jgi:hypothetical protein
MRPRRSIVASKLCASWLAVLGAWTAVASAEVVDVEVVERADVAAGGAYGAAGAYEALRGTLRFAVDPRAAANGRIADLALARPNAAGLVEFSADFYLLKPKEIARGNGALLFEVSNRGRKGILPMLSRAAGSLDPREVEELGDGFLLEQGFSLLWVGWQLDPPPTDALLLRVYPPTTDINRTVTGLVRSDFVVRTEGVRDHSLGDGDHVPYPVADPASDAHTLTVRDAPLGERHTIPRSEWQFARVDGSGNVVPDGTHVYLASGFTPKRIYEVVYTAAHPPLAGLGLAAIRDAVTRLKHEGAPELGLAADSFDRALAFGISQSGRLLRSFLYEGFNADERERRVFDGVLAHIAGGARGGFNTRFAQASRSSASFLYPNELFPFSDAAQEDPATGLVSGLLEGVPERFRPRIFYTNSSNEYWRGSAALTHVTPDGRRDFPPPDTTRSYFFAGTQHGPASFPPRSASGQLADNPNAYSWFMRALILRLDAWVEDDLPPPPSVYPTLGDGSLVPRAQLKFPTIPGVAVPREPRGPLRLDFGPSFAADGIATIEPPRVGAPFPVLLPQVDADGNELAGLRSPELAVPLATYTGWQLYKPELGRDDELVSLQGSFAPFPLDAAERERTGDPRRSILERYPDRARYLALVEQAAERLVTGGYLRAEDLSHIERAAAERWRVLVEERAQR